MRSLLASIAFAGLSLAALASARPQGMPDATPSFCPSPSAANSLVDTTMQHDCVTPKPSPTATPHRASPQPSSTPFGHPTPFARPSAQPTSKSATR
ncbi:MAG: hypothetical protein JO322_00970 [Candidatus Eremiobacteraeota bacterium]|nr:hypothetical protein [Candidatus Eremiobacteraeota bacterium]